MSFKNSRYNLTANIAQQLSAMLIATIVPLVLSVEGYAQVVVVNALIGFIPLADLGMSTVYTLKLPALYAKKSLNEIQNWNATLCRFKLYTSLIFGAGISLYYFHRYPHGVNAFMLFGFVVFSLVSSFVNVNATVQSDFQYIRNISIIQSLGRILILPGVWVAGIHGWFFGQFCSTLVTFVNKRFRKTMHESLCDNTGADWVLIKTNLASGVILSLITTLWAQLLSSGRIYAAFVYPDVIVAQYGLVGSIHQIIVSMSIAVFVPQTIKIYRLVEQDRAVAIHYALKLVIYTSPIFILFGITFTYVMPIAVETVFPKYNINSGLYAPLMLSLFNSALMVTQGSLLIAMGKTRAYLTLIALAAVTYFGFIFLLTSKTNYLAAAQAQLLTMSIYSIALVIVVGMVCGKQMFKQKMMWLAILPSLAAPVFYFMFFRG